MTRIDAHSSPSEGHPEDGDGRPERGDGAVRSAEGASPRLLGFAWSKAQGLRELDATEAVREAYSEPDAFLWVDIQDPDHRVLEELTSCLDLHPLIVEDIIERNQRAKFELIGEVAHLVVFALGHERELLEWEIDLVLGERFLLSSHAAGWRAEETQHLRHGVEPYLRDGPDRVLWTLVDAIVDGYFPIFDKVADETDQLQQDVLDRPSRWVLERIFQVRRDLITIRHAVTPQREIFNQLTNRDLALIREDQVVYFRDVYDHLIRLTDELDTHRELVTGALDAYLSQVNNSLSEVMKRLTAVTAILAGIGAWAGIFGMSEAATAFRRTADVGFWAVTGIALAIGMALFVYFRRIGWI
jgi:magnesium transporter